MNEKIYKNEFSDFQYRPLPKIPLPKPAPRGAYGDVKLNYVVSLFDHKLIPETRTVINRTPKTFEELQLSYGYVLYHTLMPENIADPSMLRVPNLRDRAVVYINQVKLYYSKVSCMNFSS